MAGWCGRRDGLKLRADCYLAAFVPHSVAAFLVIPSPPGRTRTSDGPFSAFPAFFFSFLRGSSFSFSFIKKPFQMQHTVSLNYDCVAVFCTTDVAEQLGIDRDLQLACGSYSKLHEFSALLT